MSKASYLLYSQLKWTNGGPIPFTYDMKNLSCGLCSSIFNTILPINKLCIQVSEADLLLQKQEGRSR